MKDIVGVRFKRAGRIYYFDPGELDLGVQQKVVVETDKGLELGWVVIGRRQVAESELQEPLKRVVRVPDENDLDNLASNKAREAEALAKCTEMVRASGLPMKPVAAEYSFDGSRLVFYFTAERRVDFRDLVRELASTFRTRIELRQIGVRDEARAIDGVGRCGLALCCSTWLSEFAPLSIEMAKKQALPLNPSKISGACGRLMCCLAYESQQYMEMKRDMPGVGEQVCTPYGPGQVASLNVIKGRVGILLENEATVELPVSKVTWTQAPQGPPAVRKRRRRRRR